MEEYLGWPLEKALLDMAARGIPRPALAETAAPRGGCEGTLRIVAVREGTLITARFLDASPQKEHIV